MSHLFKSILSFLIGFFLFTGCQNAVLKNQDILPETSTNDTIIFQDTGVIDHQIVEMYNDSVDTLNLIDSLIHMAYLMSDQSDFKEAHAYIKRTADIIEEANGLVDIGMNDSNDFFMRIAELYTNKLPLIYIDSIPENLEGIIFRCQLSMSIDTLSLSLRDSILLFQSECEDGTPYNVPIVRNKRVLNALSYIVNVRPKTMESLLSRASYYLPYMQKIFKDNGLPTDLVYLPILESGFNPKAYSYAHASGIWQFIPSTGKIYGLRQNYWIDERRDPIKSTLSAIAYLKKLYADFNDWYLALAAYNCGERRVEREIQNAQSKDFWHLRLPRQTMNYVPQFIAYQMIGKNPHCFGFQVKPREAFNLDTVLISDCLDLNKLAHSLNISHQELKAINPHIRKWCTPPDVSNVTLYLPPGKADSFKSYYNQLSDKDKVKWYRYRIKNGDNLIRIAKRFRISVEAIKSINKIRGSFIIAGRYLYIPIPVNPPHTLADGSLKSAKNKRSKGNKTSLSNNKKPSQTNGMKLIHYRISSGETLYSISALLKVSIQDICRWNKISNPRKIKAGKVLKIFLPQPIRHSDKIRSKDDTSYRTKDRIRGTYVVRSGDNLYSIARKFDLKVNDLANWNSINIVNPTIHPGDKLVFYSNKNYNPHSLEKIGWDKTVLYKIKKGDSIYSLAKTFSVDIDQILRINNIHLKSIIRAGDIIRIPVTEN